MPHATVSSEPSRITILTPVDTNKFSKLHIRGRQNNNHQREQHNLYPNNSIAHWVETFDMGNSDQLSPDDAITGSGRRRSGSRLSNLNPFSPSSSSRSRRSSMTSSNGDDTGTSSRPHLSPTSSFSLSRALSRSRSPLMNPSPATRRPRQPSPPPAYSKNATNDSGSALGASPLYTDSGAWAPAPAPASFAAATASSSSNSSSISRRQATASRQNNRKGSGDRKDELAFLSQFDTILLIDDSKSMWGSSWEEVEAALAVIAPVCTAYDEDGVDVYFLDHKSDEKDAPGSAGTGYRNVRSAAEVTRLFQRVGEPMGNLTLTGMRLQHILQTYMAQYEKMQSSEDKVKAINIIVLTDGEPSDEPADVIRHFAKRLDKLNAAPYQVGIQFFQVGDDVRASAALKKLDDEIKKDPKTGEETRDIVDTVTFDKNSARGRGATLTKEGLAKTVLGGVSRRHDEQKQNISR